MVIKYLKLKKIMMILGTVFLMSFTFLIENVNARPVLFFSDLTSGPKTGLGDGLGSGAIITIWGNNLGSSQGTSKAYFKDSTGTNYEMAHIYYWVNADGKSGGGPADLYSFHKMQEIAFSIPFSSADGAGKIYVSVDGINSNELDFNIRQGNIYHIKSNGSNFADGSWASPWATMQYFTSSAANGAAAAGAIVYVSDLTSEAPIPFGMTGPINGTADLPYFLVAYPGATVIVNSDQTYNWGSHYKDDAYWHIAKIKLTGPTILVSTPTGGRVIGCELTDHPTVAPIPSQVGVYMAGASNGSGGGAIGYGNYIHDCQQGINYSQMHTTYFSNRSGGDIAPYDFSWNYLRDNDSNHGIHTYDEGAGGNYTGTCKIHDNVVVNQSGISIGINCGAAQGYGVTTNTFEVYNNLIIESGKGPIRNNGTLFEVAVAFGTGEWTRWGADYKIKFYNNTIYGWGAAGDEGDFPVIGAIYINPYFNSIDIRNNIFVDTKDLAFFKGTPPTTHSNNLWYNGGDENPSTPPSWDINALTSSPLFTDSINGDFHLQSTSPAIDAGTSDVSTVVTHDFDGNQRPMDGDENGTAEYDIGAYEVGDSSGDNADDDNDGDDTNDDGDDSGGGNCFIATSAFKNSFFESAEKIFKNILQQRGK